MKACKEQYCDRIHNAKGFCKLHYTKHWARYGADNPRKTKLTTEKVTAIREACQKGALSQSEIAKLYGISQALVSLLHRRKRWGWLS